MPALLVLGGATMVMVTGEMLPTAVLAPMSAGLGVSEASTSLLVSAWALVVVVASFPLVRLTRSRRRTPVIAGSLVAFGVSAALTGLAATYEVAFAARIIGAAAVGLLWSTVNAHVADLVTDRLLGRATAIVLGGATLGMVVGTPMARMVADLVGWRASFGLLAGISLVGAVLVRVVVPDAPDRARDAGEGSTERRRSIRPMTIVTLLVALLLVGHYGAYTFVTRLAEHPAHLVPGGIGGLLLVFGVASALGVLVAARATASTTVLLVGSAVTTGVAIGGLALADRSAVLGLVVVVLWGVASGALPPLAQTLVLRLAGTEHRTLAGALIPVLFNGGIAIGAALAAGVVSRSGPDALPIPAAALVLLAALGLGLAGRGRPTEHLRANGLGCTRVTPST